MSAQRFKRVIRFYNMSLDAEFSDGDNFNKLLIFFPPIAKFGGSMYNPIISSIFDRCAREQSYALRLDFPNDAVEKTGKFTPMEQHAALLDHMLLQATIAYEEGKSQFAITSQSIYNIWLVGVSSGAWLAFQILKRRIEIQGIIMISPVGIEFASESCEKTIPNTFYIYGENDPLTSVTGHQQVIHNIHPEYTKQFATSNHIMSDITEEVTDYVFHEINSHNKIQQK